MTGECILVFMMIWPIICGISNIWFYAHGIRDKVKRSKKEPRNKPLTESILMIENIHEEIGLTHYAAVKRNLMIRDKLASGNFFSIALVFLIPYPVVLTHWSYEIEDEFSLTDANIKEINSGEDLRNFYDRKKAEKDYEKNKVLERENKINLINKEYGKH